MVALPRQRRGLFYPVPEPATKVSVRPDEPFTMNTARVALENSTAVVRVEVAYGPPTPHEYRDLWVIRLGDDGRCRSFEEWPYGPGQPPAPALDRDE